MSKIKTLLKIEVSNNLTDVSRDYTSEIGLIFTYSKDNPNLLIINEIETFDDNGNAKDTIPVARLLNHSIINLTFK